MTNFRHLIWMLMATLGLMLAVTPGHAQQPDVGDQPGLLADDFVELDPECQKQVVYYRTTEAPGTIIIHTTERHLYLVQPGRPRDPLRHRRRPRRLPVAGPAEHHAQGGVAGLDAAAGDDRSASPICRASWPAAPAIRSAPARMYLGDHGLPHPRHQPAATRSAPTVSSGCFRLVNPDVIDLYDRVPVGTKVVVRQKPEL